MATLEELKAELARRRGQQPKGDNPSALDYVAQAGAGSQEGIAQMLGFPVDAVASGISGLGEMTGMWGPIENPVGGSASIDALISPLRKNVPDPSTQGLRMARRVGEEVGASAAMAPVAMASPAVRAMPGRFAAAEGASAVGSGTGAAVANEIAPGSALAEITGALLGGVPAGYGATRAMGVGGTPAQVRPGIEDQRMRARDAYSQVRADQRVLPQSSVDNMAQDLQGSMARERINPRLQPGSSAVLDAILDDTAARPSRIEDIENFRRMTTRSMPATAAPDDRRLAEMMKAEITDYLDNLNDPVADVLREGRDAHRRASAAQSVSDAQTKAARRAASTGSGGNEINAMRQNLRRILDNPRLSRSFTAEELELIDQVVQGTAPQNLMRRLSRFAPSSGGLSAMLGIGGAMASPMVALPIMGATEIAKRAGENSTQATVNALLQNIAPNRVLKPGQQGLDGILRALLAGRTTAAAGSGDRRTKE